MSAISADFHPWAARLAGSEISKSACARLECTPTSSYLGKHRIAQHAARNWMVKICEGSNIHCCVTWCLVNRAAYSPGCRQGSLGPPSAPRKRVVPCGAKIAPPATKGAIKHSTQFPFDRHTITVPFGRCKTCRGRPGRKGARH